MTLQKSVISGMRYSGLGTIVQYSFQLIVSIIMARLLAPEIFGLMAMATVFTGINNIFADFGTRDAIIRHEKVDRDFLSSIFWFNTFISGLFFGVMVILSGSIAEFYGYPIIRQIINLLSLNILFSATSIVPKAILMRDMNFRALFLVALITPPISGGVGIYLAVQGFGIWSLVFQQMIAVLVRSILVWFLVGWSPKILFKLDHIREIFSYSSFLIFTKIANYFTKQGDLFLIGRFLGAAPLGIYSKGYGLLTTPLKMINGTIIPVVFSAISKIQEQVSKLQKAFLSASKNMAIIYLPLLVGSIFLAEPFILLLLGDKWVDVVPLVPIFTLNLLFVAQSSIASHFLKALGETKKLFIMTMVTSVVMIISFIIGLQWGIKGVAINYCLAIIFEYFLFTTTAIRLIDLSLLKIFLNLKEVIFNALVMVLTIVIFQALISITNFNKFKYAIELLIPGFFGLVFYLLSTWITLPDFRSIIQLLFLKDTQKKNI
jgi:O-antigen/teichoic acid export membrane protein